jgi:hypothetical protein
MTQPTGTFDSYDAIGNREDLTDMIYNISPTDTPFMTLASRGVAYNTLHEWQTDSLATAADNAAVEGDNASGNSITATTRLNNRTQISQKTIVTSGTQNAIRTAGRDREQAYQKAKAMSELKRDMEVALTGNYTAAAGDATTARHLRSLESWYTTNTSRGTNGANGSATQAATDATTAGIRALTESLLKTVLQSVYTNGGDPDVLMVGPFNKQAVSGFAGNATAFRDSSEQKLFAGVDVYVSDFGELKVIPNRFSRARTAHVLDTKYWSVAYLRDFMVNPLAKTGDSEQEQLLVEYTLEARNQAASGVIADLSTS